MKKILLWLTVVVVCLAVVASFGLAGCKTETPATGAAEEETPAGEAAEEATGEEIVLRFTDFQGGNEGILKSYNELMVIFEEDNPGVTIDYQQHTVTTYNEFLKPAISGGTAPDLFAVYPGLDLIDVAESCPSGKGV